MEENSVHNTINVLSNNAINVNNKKLCIKTSLSTPPPYIFNNTNNNKPSSSKPAVKNFGQSAKALGMSSKQSVTNGKVAQLGKSNSIPVLSNADSGATGNYIRLADINVLRDVRASAPEEQIAVAVADGNLLQSTHHGFLDVPGHGSMIAHVFPQLR